MMRALEAMLLALIASAVGFQLYLMHCILNSRIETGARLATLAILATLAASLIAAFVLCWKDRR